MKKIMKNTKEWNTTEKTLFQELKLGIRDLFVATIMQDSDTSMIMRLPNGNQYRIELKAL